MILPYNKLNIHLALASTTLSCRDDVHCGLLCKCIDDTHRMSRGKNGKALASTTLKLLTPKNLNLLSTTA